MRWLEKETDLAKFYIYLIENKKISVYRAAIMLSKIINKGYQSCYDKIQRERRKLK